MTERKYFSQKLTDTHVRSAKPKDQDYWLDDGGALRLLVKKNGTKCWRFNYRFAQRQKTLSIGTYPQVSLKEARECLLKAKKQLQEGIDPSYQKQQDKRALIEQEKVLFECIAKEWWEHQKGTWTEDHATKLWNRLHANTHKLLGKRPVVDITPQDVIYVIRDIEKRKALDVSARVLQDVRRVFRYAVQLGLIQYNPAAELCDIRQTRKTQHHPSLPADQLPLFLNELESYDQIGRQLTKLAIKLLIFTMLRPGELRAAEWSEIDFENKTWRIPPHRMKMKTEHLVPLSKQAISLLDEIKTITGQYALVFPSEIKRTQCMSDNTMRRAIFKLGYDGTQKNKNKCVPHGFRATACSILNEYGFNPDAIERQLSHAERNGVRAAYIHHARFLKERRKMMQWWGDYLEKAKKSAFK